MYLGASLKRLCSSAIQPACLSCSPHSPVPQSGTAWREGRA